MAKQKKAAEFPEKKNNMMDDLRRFFGAFLSRVKPLFTAPLSDRKAFIIIVWIFVILSLPVFIKPLGYIPAFQFYFEGLGEYFTAYYHPLRTQTFFSEVDSIAYYSYMPSIFIDHDVDFTNQYARFTYSTGVTKTGLPSNLYSIGPAILWFPFFFAGHLMSAFLNFLGVNTPLDGYSLFYELPCFFASIFYGFLGMITTFFLCRKYFSPRDSFLASIFTLFATPVIFYFEFEPSMAHAVGYFAAAACFYFYAKSLEDRSFSNWAITGLFGGLTALIRWQCATLIVFILFCDFAWVIYNAVRAKEWGLFVKMVPRWAVCCLIVLLVFIPQFIVWQALLGNFMDGFGIAGGHMYWNSTEYKHLARGPWDPKIVQTLFSSDHGLFTWTPIVLPALIGFFLLTRRKPSPLFYSVWLYFISQIYLVSISDWVSGWAFGQRRLMETFIIIPLGLCEVFRSFGKSKALYIAGIAVGVFLVLWNFTFIYQWVFGYVPKAGDLSLSQLTYDKFWVFPVMLQRMIAPVTGLFNIW